MQFARIFTVEGDRQLLCVLQDNDDDGTPEIRVTTYVGEICVVFANRLVAAGERSEPAYVLRARTRECFDKLTQDDAEQAYRMAVTFAAQQAAGGFDAPDWSPVHPLDAQLADGLLDDDAPASAMPARPAALH